MRKTFTKKWLHHMGIGFHALLASIVCMSLVNILFYIAAAFYHLLFDDTKELDWLETSLGALFYLLIGVPLFGFFFSRLYPKTDVTPDESVNERAPNEHS